MEPNLQLGSEKVAADISTNVHFYRFKLVIGAIGADDGNVSLANPLPVLSTKRTKNTNDVANISGAILLDALTSVKIADANPDRIFFCVNNDDGVQAVFIKLQAASIDNIAKGIFLTRKTGSHIAWQMPSDNIYTGEISAIAVAGTPSVFVTEY